jgi:hypothetical protein
LNRFVSCEELVEGAATEDVAVAAASASMAQR